ncbi:MAG: excinuclease ABC subunit UvrA [Planctomycetia bacterium]|nr:excinuclease ABC subunit UvrA [Planctomycetia bacterium]
MSDIIVKGAREHNLSDIDLVLPRNQLICLTGVSGSGKSSLAFDTLYAEGQRRYIESLSSYARQFLGQLPKPDVDQISGLSPAISIAQKTAGQNSRSTVGTITEIYDFLRVLFARVSTGYCTKCGRPITAQTRDQILAQIQTLPEMTRFLVLAPMIRNQKGEYHDLFADLRKSGFLRARVDGKVIRLEDELRLDRQMRHTIEVVIDRLVRTDSQQHRIAEAVEHAIALGKGQMIISPDQSANAEAGLDQTDSETSLNSDLKTKSASKKSDSVSKKSKSASKSKQKSLEELIPPLNRDLFFSTNYACTHCNISFEPPTPQLFSFNSPLGMCPHCQGLGFIHTFDPKLLIPDASKSFQQGCIIPIGKWKDLGRWKRHIYQGVADTLSRIYQFEKNYPLETAWDELDERVKRAFLWGTGDQHITFTWRNGVNGHKWGGTFDGIIPLMLKQYNETGSKMQKAAMEKYMSVIPCGYCNGQRINEQACAYRLETLSESPFFQKKKLFSLPELCNLSIVQLLDFFSEIKLSESGQKIAEDALKEIRNRLGFLMNVGLEYLSLGRTAPTLSGGEMQRIRLASQIGSGLVGVLYILDEPSIGLHQKDNERLIQTLTHLRDLGNTVIVVEHDEETMLAADYLVDFGPGPGLHGGQIVAKGNVADILKNQQQNSITAKFLTGKETIAVPEKRRVLGNKKLIVRGARHNNLKNIDVEIPLGGIVCITGVSGSGKSSLVNDILVEALMRDLNHGFGTPGEHDNIEGLNNLDKMIAIDQSPIGRTPRSNPATYIKLFDEIRKLFSELPESKAKGFQPGRFSFNVQGGRCEACEGNGAIKLEMDFLADVWITCNVCEGRRFNQETLSVRFKGKSIDQILDMDVESALKHFENIPKIRHKLQMLADVGLGYMKLGQPSPTLSGGEAQRIKLAKELVKKSTGKTLYLLDEPTTGLHFADIRMLLRILKNFADTGNTVLIVEHNLDVIKMADWIIDLGPEGGEEGGEIVAQGTPEEVMKNPQSYTGIYLKKYLAKSFDSFESFSNNQAVSSNKKLTKSQANSQQKREVLSAKVSQRLKAEKVSEEKNAILVHGAKEHNLQNISVEIPRNQITVCSGPSGSGKSSLAMDTVYAEGQRRYVESLSSYARQFLGQMQKPKVDQISGISPAIAIEQKAASHSPRSTVGTITEIQDYLRVLFARLGVPYCPDCDIPIGAQSTDEIIARILLTPIDSRVLIAAPISIEVGTDFDKLWERLQGQGFLRVRIDGVVYRLSEIPKIDRKRRHLIEVVIDRIHFRKDADWKSIRSRVAGSVETTLHLSKGTLHLIAVDDSKSEEEWTTQVLSQHLSCEKCGRGFERLSPHHFSFNNPLGWCPHCEGLGVQTGASFSRFLHDPKLTLEQGALELWSNFERPITKAMLDVFARETGIPLNVPFEQLDARFRRTLFHGTADRWFDLYDSDMGESSAQIVPQKKKGRNSTPQTSRLLFRFQFKGIYPTIEEAGRLVPMFRSRLEYQMNEVECSVCLGSRLRPESSAVRFLGLTMDQICRKPLGNLLDFFNQWNPSEIEKKVAGDLLEEVKHRLQFLVDVGLDYLTLSRPSPSLSGGESQRIRLAAQIGSGLVGVLYVLDEPTIGLHPRDNRKLIAAIQKLRDLGNTLLLVEHDKEVIESADNIIDFGPQAGKNGGLVVATGSPNEIKENETSVTGPYLSGSHSIPIPINRRILL